MSGLVRFTEDSQFLYCGRAFSSGKGMIRHLGVSVDAQRYFSLDVTDFPLKLLESECVGALCRKRG